MFLSIVQEERSKKMTHDEEERTFRGSKRDAFAFNVIRAINTSLAKILFARINLRGKCNKFVNVLSNVCLLLN